ncbi:MAG: hypothetical protein ACR2PX_17905 [Endozoicomonas sp.]|uniref:hypothetical protein n=1 Tax=Endozoicomonas sp. TaxID=1892382 RepID=UPI003D9B24B9
MFARSSINLPLRNRQGDHFILTDERFCVGYERLNFRTVSEAWDFLFELRDNFSLADQLKKHPLFKTYHHSPDSFLIRDALFRGQLNVFVVYRDQSGNRHQIEALYDRIKMKPGQIIASEKTEAVAIEQRYQSLESG